MSCSQIQRVIVMWQAGTRSEYVTRRIQESCNHIRDCRHEDCRKLRDDAATISTELAALTN